MYSVIEIGSKQYKVSPGSIVYSELLKANEGDILDLKVLALSDGSQLKLGRPYLDSVAKATVVKNSKGKKIRVFKYKAKKNYKRTIGHRQRYSKLEVLSIS